MTMTLTSFPPKDFPLLKFQEKSKVALLPPGGGQVLEQQRHVKSRLVLIPTFFCIIFFFCFVSSLLDSEQQLNLEPDHQGGGGSDVS